MLRHVAEGVHAQRVAARFPLEDAAAAFAQLAAGTRMGQTVLVTGL